MKYEDGKLQINIDLAEVALVIGIFTTIFLFVGDPDLMDAIIYKLTQGAMTIKK